MLKENRVKTAIIRHRLVVVVVAAVIVILQLMGDPPYACLAQRVNEESDIEMIYHTIFICYIKKTISYVSVNEQTRTKQIIEKIYLKHNITRA